MFEVLLNRRKINEEMIRGLFVDIFRFMRQGEVARLSAKFEDINIRFCLVVPEKYIDKIPSILPNLDDVSLKRVDEYDGMPTVSIKVSYFVDKDLLAIAHSFRRQKVKEISIVGRKLGGFGKFSGYIVVENPSARLSKIYLPMVSFKNLAIDFTKNPNYLCTKAPKYLNLEKSLHFFSSERQNAIMELNSYPYFSGKYYLPLSAYDFSGHSIVVGASGSGKTKFLGTFIEQVTSQYHNNVRVLVIDPHDALRQDIGGLPHTGVFDFTTVDDSIDLFSTSAHNIVANIDAMLGLIRTLIGAQYNAKLERLVRSAIYVLIEKGDFSFGNLKKLLTDSLYRNQLLKSLGGYLPESIENFFGQSFNELKTSSYNEAFSPLIAFIDELQLLPAFYRQSSRNLRYEISQNLVTLISLSQSRLGEMAEKTIAGLILNQIFVLMNERAFAEHLIVVVDEVAVVETPILQRFLSEARKFNVSLVLAGQYYAQISPALIKSISANVSNYFCFRTSYEDAELLANNLNIKLNSDFAQDKYKLLSSLTNRQVIMRLSKNGKPNAAVMGRSLDFVPHPELALRHCAPETLMKAKKTFHSDTLRFGKHTANIFDIMHEQSTSRKKVNEHKG